MKWNVGEDPVRSGDLLIDVEAGVVQGVVLRTMSGGATCMPEGQIVLMPDQAVALFEALRRLVGPIDQADCTGGFPNVTPGRQDGTERK